MREGASWSFRILISEMKQRTAIVRWDATDFQDDCCLMERPGCQSIQRIAFLEWEIKLALFVAHCFPDILFDVKISSYRPTETWTANAKEPNKQTETA